MGIGCEFKAELEHGRGANLNFSPDGKYVSSIHNSKVVIRDAVTLKIITGGIRPLDNPVNCVRWSPDSKLMLCLLCDVSTITILSVEDPTWDCIICEGYAGITTAVWSPSSTEVISHSDCGLHLSIWSLREHSAWLLESAKGGLPFLDFSRNEKLMAVILRKDCRDHLGIYDAQSGAWECLMETILETSDASSMKFTPSSDSLCILDDPLYSLFLVVSIDGEVLARYKPYEEQLGLEDMCWNSKGSMLAIGSYDQTVHMVTLQGWSAVFELKHCHPKYLKAHPNEEPTEYLWEFPSDPFFSKEYRATGKLPKSNYEMLRTPLKQRIENNEVDSEKRRDPLAITFINELPPTLPSPNILQKDEADTKMKFMSWSSDSSHLAAVSRVHPRVLFVWNVATFSLKSCILFMKPILKLEWCEDSGRLAIATGSHRLYMWSSGGIHWLDVPLTVANGKFKVLDFVLNPTGSVVMLLSKDRKLYVSFSAEKGFGLCDS